MKALLVSACALCSLSVYADSGLSALSTFGSEVIPKVSFEEEAQLNADIPASSSVSRLDTLVDWYSHGTPLTFAEFKGYYSGRCFKANHPNEPTNAMIGYAKKQTSAQDPGPGFPGESIEVKISGVHQPGYSADVFDSDEQFPKNKRDLIRLVNEYWKKISDFTETPTLSYAYDWEANGNLDEKHELVVYNGYIVDKWTALIKQKYGEIGFKNPGEVLEMCYFFKELGK